MKVAGKEGVDRRHQSVVIERLTGALGLGDEIFAYCTNDGDAHAVEGERALLVALFLNGSFRIAVTAKSP